MSIYICVEYKNNTKKKNKNIPQFATNSSDQRQLNRLINMRDNCSLVSRDWKYTHTSICITYLHTCLHAYAQLLYTRLTICEIMLVAFISHCQILTAWLPARCS